MFFLSAVPGSRKAGYTRLKASIRNRLSGKLPPNLSGAPNRVGDMIIFNREGRQACRVGCRGVGSYADSLGLHLVSKIRLLFNNIYHEVSFFSTTRTSTNRPPFVRWWIWRFSL